MERKIIFAGPVGAGKTTSISSVSDILVAATEARASDEVAQRKNTTTVAMDYGVLNLGDGTKVHLYGTPGQERFNFMWDILSDGAMGLVILVDSARPDPVADLDMYLDSFRETIRKSNQALVIGVTRTELNPQRVDLLERINDRLAERKLSVPVFEVDGRERRDVKEMLLALLSFFDPTTSRSKQA